MPAVAVAVLCLHTYPALAQAPVSPVQGPAPGLEAPWDVRQLAMNLETDLNETQTALAQIDPQSWVSSKGAPTTYILQREAARQQVKDAMSMTKLMTQRTESLSTGLDTFLRLEALEVAERSLSEGARQYDSRANADRLSASIAHNFDARQRLGQYLVSLAASTEENFKIADSEAQRCRSSLSRQPASAGSRKK